MKKFASERGYGIIELAFAVVVLIILIILAVKLIDKV